jgi:hypothetical protein
MILKPIYGGVILIKLTGEEKKNHASLSDRLIPGVFLEYILSK